MNKKNLEKSIVAAVCGATLLAHAAYNKKPGESIIRKAIGVNNVLQLENEINDTAKRDEIQAKATEIFSQLGIENLQNKPAAVQKQAAYDILKYILKNIKFVDDYKDTQPHDQDTTLTYLLLCHGYSVNSLNSKTVALNYLFRECGIDSKEAIIKYQFGKTQKERNVLILNFQDQMNQDERVCDPDLAYTYDDYLKPNNGFDSLFMPTQTYLEKYARAEKNKYTIIDKAPLVINNQATKTTDQGLEL